MPSIAVIHEKACIGCTKCIQACPVDAIIGAAKHLHTVLADECIGCGLCVEPCPVDCVEMIPIPKEVLSYDKAFARERAQAKRHRLSQAECASIYHQIDSDAKKAYILQALA